MGNWASQHMKMTRSSTAVVVEENEQKQRKNADEIRKSKSLNELTRQTSLRNGQTSTRLCTRSSTRKRTSIVGSSSSASVSRSLSYHKSFRKETTHPISAQGRDIIMNCFENPHADLGYRICMRVFERRPDYQRFIQAVGREKWSWIINALRDFLEEVVRKIDDVASIEQLSRKYGEEHIELKQYGFKPDFWVSLADAMTIECVILDMANHQPTDTVTAWSQLVALMFSSVRDGYYAALRHQRRSSRKTLHKQSTVESTRTTSTISQDTTSSDATSGSGRTTSPLLMPNRQDSLSSNNTPSPVTDPSNQMQSDPIAYASQHTDRPLFT